MKNIALAFAFLFLSLVPSQAQSTREKNPFLKASDGFVEVKGGKVWYGIMGSGDETPLLCLHGGPGGTSRSYYHLAEIADERPVIMFDQLGSGRSDHHKDTSLLKVELFVEQVEAVRKALDLNEFYLVGSSWGTALALEYYTKYPDGVKGIIFNSPYFSTPLWSADAEELIANLPDTIQRAIEIAERDSSFDTKAYAEANRYFLSRHGRRNERIEIPFDTVPSYGSGFVYNYMWGPSEFTAKGTLKHYDNTTSLKDIEVPVLFTTGEYDEARPQTIEALSKMVEGADFVVIPNAAHYSLNDNRPAVIEAIEAFIAKQKI